MPVPDPAASPLVASPLVDWAISDHPVAYQQAVAVMEARAEAIAQGRARELVWLLEHPPLYTAGTSARSEDLLQPDRFPVHKTGRGKDGRCIPPSGLKP